MFGCFQNLAARLPNQLVSQDLVLLTEFLARLLDNASFDWEKQAGMIFFFLFLTAEIVSFDLCYVITHYRPFPFLKDQTLK